VAKNTGPTAIKGATHMASEFEDLYGPGLEGEAPDYFQTGGAGRYPALTWFNGYKINYIDPSTGEPMKQKGSPVKAVGFHFEAERLEDDLVAALRVLVEQKKAERCVVQHADGKRKVYYRLLGTRFFLLSHGIPAPSVIQRDPTKQLGVAAGTITTIKEKIRKQNTSTFVGVLAVHQDLYDAGYAESDGTPKPLVLRFKALVGRDFLTVLKVHGDYIKWLREKGVDPRKAQFWSFACLIGKSEGTVQHGSGTDTTEVYVIFNLNDDKGAWDASDTLYAGADLYRKLFTLLYDTSARPPAPGGVAVEWCRAEVARACANQSELNPDNKMPFGNSDIPDWYFIQAKAKEAAIFHPSAIANGSNGAKEDSEKDHLREAIQRHEVQADLSEDEHWIDLVRQAKTALVAGNLEHVTKLLSQAGKRRLALREATVGADGSGF
jgi:hypothetical protein